MRQNYDSEFNLSLGRLMERRRLAEGLSRRGVLNLLQESRSTQILSCYELGQKPVPLPFILKWCDGMGVGLDQLLSLVQHDMSRDPWTGKDEMERSGEVATKRGE